MTHYMMKLVRGEFVPEDRFWHRYVLRRKSRYVEHLLLALPPESFYIERNLNGPDVFEAKLKPGFTDDYGQNLYRLHDPAECAGRACVIHHPSDHHMRGFKLLWRSDRRIFERMCEHGVGHPDPDDLAWHVSQGREHEGVHGCDGCCYPPETDARAKLMADLQEYGP